MYEGCVCPDVVAKGPYDYKGICDTKQSFMKLNWSADPLTRPDKEVKQTLFTFTSLDGIATMVATLSF